MKSIYIASNSKNAGSLLVTMGMMDIISRKVQKIGFFKPIISNANEPDADIEFIRSRYNLDAAYEECFGFDIPHIEMMIAKDKTDLLLENLIEKYKELEQKYDLIICQGIQKPFLKQSFDFDINIKIAQNFGASFIDVINAKDMEVTDIIESVEINAKNIAAQKCFHFATFINRIEGSVYAQLVKELPKENIFLLPELQELDTPTVGDIIDDLQAKPIMLDFHDRSKLIRQIKVAALTLNNFLDHIQDGDLIVVPADRSEIIVGVFCALQSKSFANIAGVIIPFDMQIHPNILKLIKGIGGFNVPIFSVKTDTYTTVQNITATKAKLKAGDERKIALSLGLFNANVDTKTIESRIALKTSEIMTPMMFEYKISFIAKNHKRSIVLPESEDDRILRATEIILRSNLAEIILLGEEQTIHQRSMQLGIDISKAKIIDPKMSGKLQSYAESFYQLRKAKGISIDRAFDTMHDKTYFATMMVHLGDADAMVSGAAHTTADTIRPALQIIKTQPGISIVSSLFFICLETEVLIYADCAINENPTAEELAQIAVSTAKSAIKFGIEPKIAMLSYSTGSSGSGEDVDKVKLATKLVKEREPSLLVEGPIQYDAAIDKEVAKRKLPDSKVAGQANIFIFPDLNTGNNTYKAVQRSTGAIAIGPVLQGLNKPVNDLSRGCSVVDIVNTVAITAIQAGQNS
ncbi:phosphate acetyltransferase [Sulfurimonas sp. HSL-1716]|uniref:phosphate acetyltransferase n=1 Tax=Hydrocurvibacter sulfurireducens TaxID=3131937 RepID=UPI0031F81EF6